MEPIHHIGQDNKVKRVDHKICEEYLPFPYLTFHICCDFYILINLQSSMDVFYKVLMYKEEPSKHLIDIGLSMGCEYMLEYQWLIEQFVSSYVVLHPLFYKYWNNNKLLIISKLCHVHKTHRKQSMEWSQQKICCKMT
jgi:hypothetical protein